VSFTAPAEQYGAAWHTLLDTSSDTGEGAGNLVAAQTLDLPGPTVVVLTRKAAG
jgi:hypothetical protein